MIDTKDQISVIIVDDHARVRAGIKNLLESVGEISVIGEGKTGAEAISLVEENAPDILLLDVELPVLRGDVVARRVKRDYPEVKILALSSYNDRLYIQGMMKNGASGYITKDEAPEMLIDAIRSVHREDFVWISPRAKKKISGNLPDERTLTQRDLAFLKNLIGGKTNQELSKTLSISEGIVEKYLYLLMVKFNVSSREELEEAARLIFSDKHLQ